MDICILKFDGTHAAEEALKETMDTNGDRMAWLHEVGMVSRPLIGRLTIRASYPDEGRETKDYTEGDLAAKASGIGAYTGYLVGSLAGPLRQSLMTIEASDVAQARAAEVERKVFHLDELKEMLGRGSSALVLVADPSVCDQMVQTFTEYEPKVVRRDLSMELQRRLQRLLEQPPGGMRQSAA